MKYCGLIIIYLVSHSQLVLDGYSSRLCAARTRLYRLINMENGALRDPYPRRPPFSNCLPVKLIRKKSQFEIKIRDPKKAAVDRDRVEKPSLMLICELVLHIQFLVKFYTHNM